MSDSEEFTVEISGELTRADIQRVVENLEPDARIESLRIGIATDDPAGFSIVQDGDGEEPTDDTATSVRLQLDSDPFYLACALHGEEGWLRSEEIRERIPDSWPVTEDAVGTNLWSLADRGLVKKRPYEADRRQKEYQITPAGERAIEDALERSDGVTVDDLEDPVALAQAV